MVNVTRIENEHKHLYTHVVYDIKAFPECCQDLHEELLKGHLYKERFDDDV